MKLRDFTIWEQINPGGDARAPRRSFHHFAKVTGSLFGVKFTRKRTPGSTVLISSFNPCEGV